MEMQRLDEDVESNQPQKTFRQPIGSMTGLKAESKKATEWIRNIPWYFQPVVPGFFNLCNSALRWAALLYIAASVLEMLISGTELVLSVMAARFIRKRSVSNARWLGVGIVAIGVLLVGFADVAKEESVEASSSSNTTSSSLETQVIAAGLLLGQSVCSVLQDLAEEVFMQESNFPATLLLGMEGSIGLFFGLIIYVPLAHAFHEDINLAFFLLGNDREILGWAIAFTLCCTATGIFNISATAVTSSMTRNVWKNARSALVWIFGLLLFYNSGNTDLGEEWFTPSSWYSLCGFFIMVVGVTQYYRQPKDDGKKPAPKPEQLPPAASKAAQQKPKPTNQGSDEPPAFEIL